MTEQRILLNILINNCTREDMSSILRSSGLAWVMNKLITLFADTKCTTKTRDLKNAKVALRYDIRAYDPTGHDPSRKHKQYIVHQRVKIWLYFTAYAYDRSIARPQVSREKIPPQVRTLEWSIQSEVWGYAIARGAHLKVWGIRVNLAEVGGSSFLWRVVQLQWVWESWLSDVYPILPREYWEIICSTWLARLQPPRLLPG